MDITQNVRKINFEGLEEGLKIESESEQESETMR